MTKREQAELTKRVQSDLFADRSTVDGPLFETFEQPANQRVKQGDEMDILKAVETLARFLGRSQWHAMFHGCAGEEGQYFRDKFIEYAERINTMPKTYEKDGKGENAIVYLHYFIGACDWYITERDADEDGEGQIQAFGLANLRYGAELGYINIREIVDAGAELDLHFKPRTIAEISKAA